MLEPRRLRVLTEFVLRGTIAATAEALGYTPSAISQQLSQLEHEAGVELLRHRGRRLELTDAGHLLVEHATAILDGLKRAEADLASHAGQVRGTVRIAAFQLAATGLVLPAISVLAERHPALDSRLLEAEAEISVPALQAGRVDIVIAEEYQHAPRPRHQDLIRTELGPDDMLLALPPNHPAAAQGGPVPLRSLHDTTWATAASGTSYADMFIRLCRAVGGFEPDIRHRANDFNLLLDIVAHRHAAALVPALGHPEADPRVAVRDLADGDYPRTLFLLSRSADSQRPGNCRRHQRSYPLYDFDRGPSRFDQPEPATRPFAPDVVG